MRPGSRVAVWLDNCLEYLDVYLAIAKAGLIIVPINLRFTAVEAGQILDDADVEALVFCAEVADRVAQLDPGHDLRCLIGVGTLVGDDLEVLIATGRDTPPTPPAPDDVLVIGYTSGTTGRPKGAMLTHASIEHVGLTNALSCRYRQASTHVFAMSLSFTATVPAHVLPHLYVGGTTILHSQWDSEALVECIERRGGDFAIVPSPALREVTALLEQRPGAAASLGSVLHSASKATAADLGALVEVLGDKVVEGWGMTESSGGLLTASHPGDLVPGDRERMEIAGRAVPGTEIRVVEEVDGVGQLSVRAASLFRGYWRDEVATAAAFADGWFATGDLGRIDADGLVTIHDRRADLINSGGMNVYPSEVERVLMESGRLVECAVVGAAHDRWGQVPVAFVVPTGPSAAQGLAEFAADRLAGYKRPSRIVEIDALPRNTGGKIERAKLMGWAQNSVHP